MKTKNKIALILILLALIVGVASLILIRKNKTQNADCNNSTSSSNGECRVDLNSIEASASASITNSVTASSSTTSEFDYHNAKFGFGLTFNSSWKGYTESQKTENNAEAVYEFMVPTKDSNFASGSATPLTIKIFTPNNFPADSNLTKIFENSSYVFAYSIWQQSPSDAIITDKDIANVISTFKM